MTNADNIRNMSNEELTDFFMKYFSCEFDCPALRKGCYKDCRQGILDWLNEEV